MGRPKGSRNRTSPSEPEPVQQTQPPRTVHQRITSIALHLLKNHPDGIKYTELVHQILEADKSLNANTVGTTTSGLDTSLKKLIYKPDRGLFRLIEFRDNAAGDLKTELTTTQTPKVKETEFYQPFADWLMRETEECTKAIPLGGNLFGGKWGTPDVIGKRESRQSDILKVQTEIVSAEIKTNVTELITAFGQACAFSLFSHKTYLVIPRTSSQEDISRLDPLCQGFGIGLVLFDTSSAQTPEFTIRVRPKKHEPDMFYTNKFMGLIEEKLFS
jgi:hypothetical protein